MKIQPRITGAWARWRLALQGSAGLLRRRDACAELQEKRIICLGKQDEQKEDLEHARTWSYENTRFKVVSCSFPH